jgi:RHS repeat-associated protein
MWQPECNGGGERLLASRCATRSRTARWRRCVTLLVGLVGGLTAASAFSAGSAVNVAATIGSDFWARGAYQQNVCPFFHDVKEATGCMLAFIDVNAGACAHTGIYWNIYHPYPPGVHNEGNLTGSPCGWGGTTYANIDTTCPSTGYTLSGNTCVPNGSPNPDKNAGCPKNPEGNPCDPSNGNKYQEEVDYVGAGPSPLPFIRYYNSLGNANLVSSTDAGNLSQRWRHEYGSFIKLFTNSSITTAYTYRPEGKIYAFTLSGSTWVADSDINDYLVSVNGGGWTYTRRDGTVEYYDALGRLSSVVDRQGLSRTLTYDTNGRLGSLADSFGHTLIFGYDSNGRLASLTDPAGNIINYDYDDTYPTPVPVTPLGNLTRVRYPDQTAKIYYYGDGNNPLNLTGIAYATINPDGSLSNVSRFSTYGYNSTGKAILTEHAITDNTYNQEKFTFAYDAPAAGQTTVTAAPDSSINKVTEVMTFITNLGVKNLVSKTTSIDTKSLQQTFDVNNNLTCRKDEENRVTLYSYNGTNQKLSMTEGLSGTDCNACIANPANCNVGGVGRVTTYDYLSPTLDLPRFVRRPSVASGLTFETEIVYGGAGHPNLPTQIIQRGYTPAGTAVSRTVTLGYNSSGQVNSIDGPRTDVNDVTTLEYYPCTTGGACGQLSKVTNALGQITTYDLYDPNGRLTQMTDPNGAQQVITYDARARLRLVSETGPDGAQRYTRYLYNAAGQVRELRTYFDGRILTYTYDAAQMLHTVTDNFGNRIEYRYDLKGNRTQAYTYDPDGSLVRQVDTAYDLRNRVGQINAAGSLTQLIHDAVGNLTQETDPNQSASGNPKHTTHGYDALNRLFQTVNYLNKTTQYGHDINDRVSQVAAPLSATTNATTQYQYDDLGNPLQELSPDRGPTNNSHDAAGNLTITTDARGKTVSYSYDALNRVNGIDYSGTVEDVSLTYDTGAGCTNGIGRLCRVQDGSGATTYAYDGFGHLAATVHTELDVSYTTGYGDDPWGRRLTLTYPGGRQVTYTRDALGRVTQIAASVNGSSVVLVNNRSYRADGLVKTQSFGNGLSESRVYDLQGRLSTDTLGVLETQSYDYDPNGNLSTRQTALHTGYYLYDALNRLRLDDQWAVISYDANGNRNSWAGIPYSYDPNSNRLVQVGSESLSLDAAGNLQGDALSSFAYYGSGRLKAVINGATGLTSYTYNVQGLRTRKVGFSATTVFHYDAEGRLLMETTGGGTLIRAYVWDDTVPIAQIDRNPVTGQETLVYLHSDHIGTPRLATNQSGTVVWRWEGAAFGESAPTGSVTVNLRYPGQYFDQETGLYYNGARYYDPRIGRYISSDPIGLRGGLNTYLYASANPLRYIDPRGLFDWAALEVSVKLGLGLSAAGYSMFNPDNSLLKPLIGAAGNWTTTAVLVEGSLDTNVYVLAGLSSFAGGWEFGTFLNNASNQYIFDNNGSLGTWIYNRFDTGGGLSTGSNLATGGLGRNSSTSCR